MKNIQEQIEIFKKEHPEIAAAMEVFKIGMAEYQRAYKFLNEPKIYSSNTTNSDHDLSR